MLHTLAATLLLLAGPAKEREAPATAAEIKAAYEQYIACLFGAAEQLDDGISDARTVGSMAAGRCRNAMLAIVEVDGRGQSERVKQGVLENMLDLQASTSAEVVLTMRANRRASGAAVPPTP